MVDNMANLVEQMFSTFTTVIKGLAGGIKTAFNELIYVDASAASPRVNNFVIFIFVMAGVGLATGILYKIFGMIRSRKG